MARGARRSRASRPDGSRVTKGRASPAWRRRSRCEQRAARRRRRVQLGDRHARDLAQAVGQPRQARGAVSQEKRGRRARARAAGSPARPARGRGRRRRRRGTRASARSCARARPRASVAGSDCRRHSSPSQPGSASWRACSLGAGVPGVEARLAHELGRDRPRPRGLRRPSIPGPPPETTPRPRHFVPLRHRGDDRRGGA